MTMLEKIRQIEDIFRVIDDKTVSLQKETKIFCPPECVLCCLKPGLEANVLECLPLAFHLVSTGLYEGVIEKIESGQEVCICLNQERNEDTHPGCKYYPYRPFICRLFGSAAIRDSKTGKHSLYACKTLKENYAEEWESVREKINLFRGLPVVADYYLQLIAVDPFLAGDYNPINQSIIKAIGAVSRLSGSKREGRVTGGRKKDKNKMMH
jgi:uncharacterized protein